MDEAIPRIRHTLAGLQGLPAGAVMTEAKQLARNAVKAQYQARGLKFYTTPPPRSPRLSRPISTRTGRS